MIIEPMPLKLCAAAEAARPYSWACLSLQACTLGLCHVAPAQIQCSAERDGLVGAHQRLCINGCYCATVIHRRYFAAKFSVACTCVVDVRTA